MTLVLRHIINVIRLQCYITRDLELPFLRYMSRRVAYCSFQFFYLVSTQKTKTNF